MMKTIITWIIAIVIASLFFILAMKIIGFFGKIVFTFMTIVVFMIPIFIIAVPIYLVIKKKFIR